MGEEIQFKLVKLFTGVIYSDRSKYLEVKQKFEEFYSKVDFESEEFVFDFTTYYNAEMGESLYRRFISFKELIDPCVLPDIKKMSNQMEIDYSIDNKRIVNIDPGFVSDANVILATTKNHYHRIPLRDGIYAHMEYVIKKRNTLTALEWTYPDFRTRKYMEVFEKMIPIFKKSLKELRQK